MVDVVIDTNIVYSALRSQQGASHKMLLLLAEKKYCAHLTVPLFLEYEEQIMRLVKEKMISLEAGHDVLDYICKEMVLHSVHFLWRPFLRDADDDMVLEAAVASGSRMIVTHNLNDFGGVEKFGLAVISPGEFLKEMESEQ